METDHGDLSSDVLGKNNSRKISQRNMMQHNAIANSLAWMSKVESYKDVGFLRAIEDNEPFTMKTEISIKKVVAGFKAFGQDEEANIVEQFLKGIGSYSRSCQELTFTP